MKHILITTIAAVLVVGCGESQSPEPPTAKAPDISIHDAVFTENIEAVKQHLIAGTDVNAKTESGLTLLMYAVSDGRKEIAELLIANGADVNAKDENGRTPLHQASLGGHKEVAELLIGAGADVNAKIASGAAQGLTPLDAANETNRTEIVNLLRKHGGKTGAELKAEGK